MKFMRIINYNKDIIYHLNYVRMKKEVVIPFEVVEFEGNSRTSCCSNINEKSSISWKIEKKYRSTNH